MKITVRFFSILKEIIGSEQQIIHMEDKSTIADLFIILTSKYDILAYRNILRFALNREYVDDTQPLTDGDEVALITPVAGG